MDSDDSLWATAELILEVLPDQIGRILAGSGPHLHRRTWPDSAQIWPIRGQLGRFGSKLPRVWLHEEWVGSSRFPPNSTVFSPIGASTVLHPNGLQGPRSGTLMEQRSVELGLNSAMAMVKLGVSSLLVDALHLTISADAFWRCGRQRGVGKMGPLLTKASPVLPGNTDPGPSHRLGWTSSTGICT